MRSMSPTLTSRAGFAVTPFDSMRPSSQARAASARVLKNRAAQSHLSMRTPFTPLFSASADRDADRGGQRIRRRRVDAIQGGRPGRDPRLEVILRLPVGAVQRVVDSDV